MSRKIVYLIRIIINFFISKIIFICSLGRIKINSICLRSLKSHLKSNNSGTIDVGKKVVFEDGVLIRSSGGAIKIGNSVYVNRNCNLISRSSITINDGVTIGPNVCVYDHDHNFKSIEGGYISSPIVIEENVWIGANSIILKGVKIGNNSVIASGTVVTKDVEPYTILSSEIKYIKKEFRKL